MDSVLKKEGQKFRNAPSYVTANTHSALYFWLMTAVLTAVLCVFKAWACGESVSC